MPKLEKAEHVLVGDPYLLLSSFNVHNILFPTTAPTVFIPYLVLDLNMRKNEIAGLHQRVVCGDTAPEFKPLQPNPTLE